MPSPHPDDRESTTQFMQRKRKNGDGDGGEKIPMACEEPVASTYKSTTHINYQAKVGHVCTRCRAGMTLNRKGVRSGSHITQDTELATSTTAFAPEPPSRPKSPTLPRFQLS